MIRPRAIKLVALLLIVFAALWAFVGYDAINNRNVTDDPAPRRELF